MRKIIIKIRKYIYEEIFHKYELKNVKIYENKICGTLPANVCETWNGKKVSIKNSHINETWIVEHKIHDKSNIVYEQSLDLGTNVIILHTPKNIDILKTVSKKIYVFSNKKHKPPKKRYKKEIKISRKFSIVLLSHSMYQEFKEIKNVIPGHKIDVKGGGDLGKAEHGNPHFKITNKDRSVNCDIYIPYWDEEDLPETINIETLNYKSVNTLDKKIEKKLKRKLNNRQILLTIGKYWEDMNENNRTPGLEHVKWNELYL